jgi:outer membrane biosynthesis protein TonB
MAQLNVWVVLTYEKSGRLASYRIEKASGDVQFDESVKRALLKSQQLEQPLPARLEDIRVTFNLKELKALAESRR